LNDNYAPYFRIYLEYINFSIDDEDVTFKNRIPNFDPELNKIEQWNLQCIDYSHNEVEDFGLDSSLQVLFVNMIIKCLEDDEKDEERLKSYPNLYKKGINVYPKSKDFKIVIKESCNKCWNEISVFNRLSRCKYLGKYTKILDRDQYEMFNYIQYTDEILSPTNDLINFREYKKAYENLYCLIDVNYYKVIEIMESYNY